MKDIWKEGVKITPADLRQALEEAVARGEDRAMLERQHAAFVKFYGGEDKFAAAWTLENWRRAYAAQLRPHEAEQAKPAQASRKSPDDRKRLIELIREYPELAQEVIGDLPRPDC